MRRANGRIRRFRCRGKNSWKIVEDSGKSWDCRSYSRENRGSDMSSATGLTRKEKKQNWRWRGSIMRSESGRRRIGRSFSVLHPKSVDPFRRHSWITVHGCAEFRCRGRVSNPPYGKTLARLCSKPGNQVETKRRSLFR